LALATFASAGLFNAAHATYPGENGVIVFQSHTFERGIYSVSPGNSAVSADLAPGLKGMLPSVSPNGKKVAFLSDVFKPLGYLYVMNIDGSNIVQLTNFGVISAAWLPDGSKLAYTYNEGSWVQLWTMNPDGTGKTFVRNLLERQVGWGPYELAWSPSGNLYTFYDGDGLYITDYVNPSIRTLAEKGSGFPSWAPDGGSILFNDIAGNQFEINPDGSNLRAVPSARAAGVSAISPDGKFIAGGVRTNSEPPLFPLTIRARAGTPTTFSWGVSVSHTEWSRVPKNCYVSTPSTPLDGGGILAGDEKFYASQCAIAVMPDGAPPGILQQAIAVGPDQRLYYRLLKSDPFGPSTWTSFMPVPGGGGSPLGIKAKKIAIAAAKDGSSQVVIINAADDLVYHAMRKVDGSWSGFTPLNGAGAAPNFAARDVAIAIGGSTPTSPGNAQVIANGLTGGGLYHRVRWPDGSWTSFQPIANANTHNIALAVGEDGNANVLATMTAADGSQAQIMQVLRYASGNWSSWGTVGMPKGTTLSASTDIAVTRTLSGKAQVMFTDAAGNAFFQQRDTPNDPSLWKDSVITTLIANTEGRAVSISAGGNGDSSSQMLLTRTYPQ
jgi:hypothetical protein